MNWRVIPWAAYDAHTNMAIDEAILEAVRDGRAPPTIRFYEWQGGGVSIGRHNPSSLVRVDRCNADGVGYVRRITGGNAVFHGSSDLTYSVIAPHKVFGEVEGSSLKRKAYACILSWIIDALRTVGVDAYLYGSNDVLYDGKKIVGNAQKPLQKVLLQHGSLFYASTADEWSAYLRIPENKLEGIQNICSLGVKRDSLKTALFNAFTSNDLVRCVTVESLSDAEYARACELVDMRYAISFEDESDARSGTICALDIQED